MRTAILLTVTLSFALISACGGKGEPSPSEAVATVQNAVDATMKLTAFEMDYDIAMKVGPVAFSLKTDGGIDYEARVGNIALEAR